LTFWKSFHIINRSFWFGPGRVYGSPGSHVLGLLDGFIYSFPSLPHFPFDPQKTGLASDPRKCPRDEPAIRPVAKGVGQTSLAVVVDDLFFQWFSPFG